ncbi:MAG: hypothetical protein ACKVH0_18040, partial [Alphaproteobacteria bacterium]
MPKTSSAKPVGMPQRTLFRWVATVWRRVRLAWTAFLAFYAYKIFVFGLMRNNRALRQQLQSVRQTAPMAQTHAHQALLEEMRAVQLEGQGLRLR